MKLIHLSDLHLGKRFREFSLLEDQEYILHEILRIVDEEAPDGIMIAGDLYDKSIPSAEAVRLCDDFLVSLARRNVPVFLISGNHDSPERLAFGSRLMNLSGVHISSVYHGTTEPVSLTDAYGTVDFYLLPFIKPAQVRAFFEEEVTSYTDAVRLAVSKMNLHPDRRNVLITHQFVTGSRRCESEEISVGGTDNVDAAVFSPFDYVALGHIHSPQNCGSERLRYCGTPLKYSFSEAKDQKSVTVVELSEKGRLNLRTAALHPLHDLTELRGSYEELTKKSFYENTTFPEDYTRITLTDEEDIPDAIGKLRTIYHRLAHLQYDNTRTRTSAVITAAADAPVRSPLALFSEFYELQNNAPMSSEQTELMENLMEKIREDNLCDR